VTWGDYLLLGVGLLELFLGLSAMREADRSGLDGAAVLFAGTVLIGVCLGIGGLVYHVRHLPTRDEVGRRRKRNAAILLAAAPFLGVLGGAMESRGPLMLKVAVYGFGSGLIWSFLPGVIVYFKILKRPFHA
jgi:hypothetical protein